MGEQPSALVGMEVVPATCVAVSEAQNIQGQASLGEHGSTALAAALVTGAGAELIQNRALSIADLGPASFIAPINAEESQQIQVLSTSNAEPNFEYAAANKPATITSGSLTLDSAMLSEAINTVLQQLDPQANALATGGQASQIPGPSVTESLCEQSLQVLLPAASAQLSGYGEIASHTQTSEYTSYDPMDTTWYNYLTVNDPTEFLQDPISHSAAATYTPPQPFYDVPPESTAYQPMPINTAQASWAPTATPPSGSSTAPNEVPTTSTSLKQKSRLSRKSKGTPPYKEYCHCANAAEKSCAHTKRCYRSSKKVAARIHNCRSPTPSPSRPKPGTSSDN